MRDAASMGQDLAPGQAQAEAPSGLATTVAEVRGNQRHAAAAGGGDPRGHNILSGERVFRCIVETSS